MNLSEPIDGPAEFTLIELMVVVVIATILIAIAVPSYSARYAVAASRSEVGAAGCGRTRRALLQHQWRELHAHGKSWLSRLV